LPVHSGILNIELIMTRRYEMSENDDKKAMLNVVLAEFQALRGEIKDRASAAYTILNLNITATAAVAGFVLSDKADPRLLLILPLLSPALGMLFVDHSYNIANLGNYINERLRPLAIAAAGDSRLLGYEEFVDKYEQNKLLRFLPLGFPLMLLFAGFPCAALVFSAMKLEHAWAWALWAAGVLMVITYIALWTVFIIAPYRRQRKGNEIAP
jgi:hypothetical protein